MTSMDYPASNDGTTGEVVNYSYLNQMLLDRVSSAANTYVNNTDYDAAGRVDMRELGLSGSSPLIQVDYTYFNRTDANGQGRLKQIMSGSPADPDSLQDLRYTYDTNGNVLTIQDYKAGSPQTQTFTYDNLDRLSTAQASGGSGGTYTLQNYTYDSVTGNLASKAGVSYTYGDTAHKHAVKTMGSNTYSYDAYGNQSSRTVGGNTFTLHYDAENRLVSVSGAATASFVYDGDGNRVKGTVNGVTIAYIGSPAIQQYQEWTGSTSSMRKFYYAGSTRVAMRTGISTLRYILEDHLGGMAVTTDSNGAYQTELRYYPWGERRFGYGSIPTTFQFTGQMR